MARICPNRRSASSSGPGPSSPSLCFWWCKPPPRGVLWSMRNWVQVQPNFQRPHSAGTKTGPRPAEYLNIGKTLVWYLNIGKTLVWCTRCKFHEEAANLRVESRLVQSKPSGSGLNRRVGAVFRTFTYSREGSGGPYLPKFGKGVRAVEDLSGSGES